MGCNLATLNGPKVGTCLCLGHDSVWPSAVLCRIGVSGIEIQMYVYIHIYIYAYVCTESICEAVLEEHRNHIKSIHV